MLGRMTATPYSVTVKKNIRAEEILSSISSTFGNASYNDVSLFYYSGHGANSLGADGNPTSYHAALVGTFQTYVSIGAPQNRAGQDSRQEGHHHRRVPLRAVHCARRRGDAGIVLRVQQSGGEPLRQ